MPTGEQTEVSPLQGSAAAGIARLLGEYGTRHPLATSILASAILLAYKVYVPACAAYFAHSTFDAGNVQLACSQLG
jgi:hypothetical protein